MKRTLNVDAKLLRDAKQACGATTDTETVHRGLEALVRHVAYQRLATLLGTEECHPDVPRRREKSALKRPSSKRRAA